MKKKVFACELSRRKSVALATFYVCFCVRILTECFLFYRKVINFRTLKQQCLSYRIKNARKSTFSSIFHSGPEGNRTPVQKPIPCPSTSVAYTLTFPLRTSHRQDARFSSFIIRPPVQSLAGVVSYMVEAWILMCRCTRSDCCN